MGSSNSAWGDKTIDRSSVIRVEMGNVRSISSNQPMLNSSNEKYRAHGANERQEVNTFIETSESENVADLDTDEFRVSRDFLAYDFNDTRPPTCGEHRKQEQISKNMKVYVSKNSKNHVKRGPSVSRLSGHDVSDNTMTRWRVSASPDDRLSLPSANAVGQDNSISAFNSYDIAESHFKVYSGEYVSSSSRSEILTAVGDGQGGVPDSMNDVGGAWTPVLTRNARTSTDKNGNDSMGALSLRSAAYPMMKGARSPMMKENVSGSGEIDQNFCIISDHECIIAKSTSEPIFQWIVSNSFIADIRSMGEIISNTSDLAIEISAKEVLSWTDEAVTILKEKNTSSGR